MSDFNTLTFTPQGIGGKPKNSLRPVTQLHLKLSCCRRDNNLSNFASSLFWDADSEPVDVDEELKSELTGVEERIRAAGLVAESNVSELVEEFQFQVLEFFNRALGDLYFNGRKDPLRYALSLFKEHGFDINRLEINLDDDFDREDLEWFVVEFENFARLGSRYRYGYGLRFKTETGSTGSEQEEGEEQEEEGSLVGSDQNFGRTDSEDDL
ncbi:uncharacterized protein JCM6883_005600 [Sporobolomyces salmoneus]|uniref:uncharacterized protein n=1 Tax=Sporobolomyces salmoneus TaxID=183962 RepID=UPI00317521E0